MISGRAPMCIKGFLLLLRHLRRPHHILSHLQGMLTRTIRLLEAGLKPVIIHFVFRCQTGFGDPQFYLFPVEISVENCWAKFVFDGQPPDLKKHELAKRLSKREDATKDLNTAIEEFDFSIYSPTKSSTSKSVPCSSNICEHQERCSSSGNIACPYNVNYVSADTSSSGYLVEDLLYLTTEDTTNPRTVQTPIVFGRYFYLITFKSYLHCTSPSKTGFKSWMRQLEI